MAEEPRVRVRVRGRRAGGGCRGRPAFCVCLQSVSYPKRRRPPSAGLDYRNPALALTGDGFLKQNGEKSLLFQRRSPPSGRPRLLPILCSPRSRAGGSSSPSVTRGCRTQKAMLLLLLLLHEL